LAAEVVVGMLIPNAVATSARIFSGSTMFTSWPLTFS
jgi:hypothetical protein